MFHELWNNVQSKTPLIHAITNYVTVNDCANALLACGASPIMADDLAEVKEITVLCSATLLNIGTLNQRTIEAMHLAARTANILSHPLVLDPVGVGASQLRTQTAKDLLYKHKFTVIRGNVSEIKALAIGSDNTQGVDASLADQITESNLSQSIGFIQAFSQQTGAIIAVSGAIDIVADAKRCFIIKNGHPAMSKITGTGSISSCLIAAYLAANPQQPLLATAAATVLMGLAGEYAAKISTATGSMRCNILDALSYINAEKMEAGAKIEEYQTC